MRSNIAGLLAALALAGCKPPSDAPSGGAGPQPAAPAPPQQAGDETWIEAQRKTIRRYVQAVGTFRARQTTRVGSQVSGRVKEVLVEVGSAVKKDQVVVRLDPVLFEIELAQRKADLEAARSALAEAELNLKRMKGLWENPSGDAPSIPRKLYDDAVTRHDSAAARLQQAEAGVRHAEERLRETEIRAPYDGAVTRRFVDMGEPVTSMPITPLVEIQETGLLYLEFSLPQELLRVAAPGTAVEYEVEGLPGGSGGGRIDAVFPALDESTRTFRCRVCVDNASGRLRPGLLARVRVVEQEVENAVVIPRKAAIETADGWRILGGNGPDRSPRPVRAGIVTDDEIEIREGLKAGDRILLPNR